METAMTHDELVDSLKFYVEKAFWPQHRGLDEPVLLMLPVPHGSWQTHDIRLAAVAEGYQRNQILTRAMRQAIAAEQPFAVSVIAEARIGNTDPNAHFDYVTAFFETKDTGSNPVTELLWKLGLDDAQITFIQVGKSERDTFADLYGGAEDCIEHWVYARKESGELTLLFQGGSFRNSPMSVEAIKRMTYLELCEQYGAKLNKREVMRRLIVTYKPIEKNSGVSSK